MSINNHVPAASRQFVAQPPFWGSKMASRTTPGWQNNPGKSHAIMAAGVLGVCVVLGVLFVGMQTVLPPDVAETVGQNLQLIGLTVLAAGVVGWYWWSRRRKILIYAANDGLSVSTRPGDVYSFTDARLGTWGQTGGATMGTALHLQCGPQRFILGGRDRRLTPGTRADAPDVGYGLEVDVDAWLPAAEFEEILTWPDTEVGWISDRPHRGSRRVVCCSPTPCWLRSSGRSHTENGKSSCNRSANRGLPLMSARTRSG